MSINEEIQNYINQLEKQIKQYEIGMNRLHESSYLLITGQCQILRDVSKNLTDILKKYKNNK